MSHKIDFDWLSDLPDHRVHFYAAQQSVLAELQEKVESRPKYPLDFNHGEWSSYSLEYGNATKRSWSGTPAEDPHILRLKPTPTLCGMQGLKNMVTQ